MVQLGQQLPAVEVGQHDIQHDDVRPVRSHGLENAPSLALVHDAIARALHTAPVEVHHVRVIVHHQERDVAGARKRHGVGNAVGRALDAQRAALRSQDRLQEIGARLSAAPRSASHVQDDLVWPRLNLDADLAAGRPLDQLPDDHDQHLAQHCRVNRHQQMRRRRLHA